MEGLQLPPGAPSPSGLLLDGFLVSLVGVLGAWWLFPQEASLIAVAFTAITNTDIADRMLDWNRKSIFEHGLRPVVANVALGLMLLSLFAGALIGFSACAMYFPVDKVEILFERQLEYSPNRDAAGMTFGRFGDIAMNNAAVMFFFFFVALLFRRGGVMLAVGWNASVWGASFSLLSRNYAADHGSTLLEGYLRVMAACGPHMTLEAVAYVAGGLAGVFISKGVRKHALDSPAMYSIVQSCGLLIVIGGAFVLLGGLVESFVSPTLVLWWCG